MFFVNKILNIVGGKSKKSTFLKLAPMFILQGAQKETPHIGIHPYDASNLDYRIRRTNIPEYSTLLIYNLQMTAGGKFCKKRKSDKYGQSRYFVAKTQIEQFYS